MCCSTFQRSENDFWESALLPPWGQGIKLLLSYLCDTLTYWIILPSLNGLLEFKIEIIIVKFVCLVYVYVCVCIWRGTFACAYMFRGQKLTMCVFLSTLHLI